VSSPLFSAEIRADGSCLGPLQYAKDELREQVGAIADVVVSAGVMQGRSFRSYLLLGIDLEIPRRIQEGFVNEIRQPRSNLPLARPGGYPRFPR
jgi:hypothetical protein